ncbi:hypothetical protein CCM_06030 [Cordyceps militaris CM01]|uniref:Uncharacterized protein n=1 Tax=Cordyceps militaris (strain CM01) TaxID=983644 RepID=G3JIC2_CORMM|nr:uncharacterized protein CCM_06030 [Cordyceps militaris CM01]EGX91872.1 hypothetical protein CCM_06030 [Cordyceps militaris CM01]
MMDEERTSGTGGGVIGRWAGIYTLGDIWGEGDARLIIVVTDAATGEAGSWHVLERGKARWAARRLGPMHSAHTRLEQASTLWTWREGCSRNWWKGTMIGLEDPSMSVSSQSLPKRTRRRRAARDLVWATNHTTLASTRTPGTPPSRQRTTNHLKKTVALAHATCEQLHKLPSHIRILPVPLPVLYPPLMASFADGILLRQTVTQPPAPPPDLERSHMGFGLKSLDTDWPFGRPLQHFGPGGRFHLVWAMKGGAPSRPLTSSPALKLAWRELSGCLCNEPQSSNVLLPLKLTPKIYKDIQVPNLGSQSSLNSHGGCVLNVATNESNKRAYEFDNSIWSTANKPRHDSLLRQNYDEYDERDGYKKYNKYNKCEDYKTNAVVAQRKQTAKKTASNFCFFLRLTSFTPDISSIPAISNARRHEIETATRLVASRPPSPTDWASQLSGVPHNRIPPALGGKDCMRVGTVGVSICFTQACPSQSITRIGQNSALPTQPSYTSTKVVILSCYTSILCADNLTYSRNWNRMFVNYA